MNIEKVKCINNFEIENSEPGRHHSNLHKIIFDLEKEVKELKAEVEKSKWMHRGN
jgi:predicted RNase H-like nuclease (RuvC/YqgF family)